MEADAQSFSDFSGDDGSVRAPSSPTSRMTRGRRSRQAQVLKNAHWTYTIYAKHVRALRIPVVAIGSAFAQERVTVPTIRELRVFAVVDKQSKQSRASMWKQEPRPTASANRRRRATGHVHEHSVSRVQRSRWSGMIEDAKWIKDDGKLSWTFPMEHIRRLKAYTPRIKVFIYGIAANTRAEAQQLPVSSMLSREDEQSIISFGWIFLDLRTPDLPDKWYKLQNSPFGGEILLSTSLTRAISHEIPHDEAGSREAHHTFLIRNDTQTKISSPRYSEKVAKVSDPVMTQSTQKMTIDNEECLCLGPSNGTDIFVISVFIQRAVNLTHLIEAALGKRKKTPDAYKTGFWLSYSLFDVVVQTDVFHNLEDAQFPPIRDSFRIKSCLQDLRAIVEEMEKLSVYLCTDGRVLNSINIPLVPLLSKDLFTWETDVTPHGNAIIDGDFAFLSSQEAIVTASIAIEYVKSCEDFRNIPHQDAHSEAADQEDMIDAAQKQEESETGWGNMSEERLRRIMVSLDHIRVSNNVLPSDLGINGISLELSIGSEKCERQLQFSACTKNETFGNHHDIVVILDGKHRQDLLDIPLQVSCFSATSKSVLATSSSRTLEEDVINGCTTGSVAIELRLENEIGEHFGECILKVESLVHEHTFERESALAQGIDSNKHVYRLFIQVKSFREVDVAGTYSFAFADPFNGKWTIESESVDIVNKSETHVPEFYCMFELIKSEEELKHLMESSILIDVQASKKDSTQPQLVGNITFSFNYLYFSQESFCCSDCSCGKVFPSEADVEHHWADEHGKLELVDAEIEPRVAHPFKSCSIYLPVMSYPNQSVSALKSTHRLGRTRIVAYLEDMGLFSDDNTLTLKQMYDPQLVLKNRTVFADLNPSPSLGQTAVTTPSAYTKEVVPCNHNIKENNAEQISMTGTSNDVGTSQRVTGQNRSKTKDKTVDIDTFKESLERANAIWMEEQRLQQLQWKQRFADREKARMDELEEEWARREDERSALLRSTQTEYQRLEQTFRKSLIDLEARERRLTIAEAAIQREQRTQREDHELLVKRLQTEHSHAVSIAQKQVEVHEKRAQVLEEQLRDMEKRARQVEADFAEYRNQQRKVPESRLREEIASLKGTIVELEKQKNALEKARDVAEDNVEKMRLQLEKMATMMQSEKRKNETRAVEELEKLRLKYIAREEKYVLDGDREELRAIKQQLDDLKRIQLVRKHTSEQNEQMRHRTLSMRSHGRVHHGSSATGSVQSRTERRQIHESPRAYSEPISVSESDSDDHISYSRTRGLIPRRSNAESSESVNSPSLSSTSDDEAVVPTKQSTKARHKHTDLYQNMSQVDRELQRLVRERELLLASSAYDEQSYLVRELDRCIAAAKANMHP